MKVLRLKTKKVPAPYKVVLEEEELEVQAKANADEE